MKKFFTLFSAILFLQSASFAQWVSKPAGFSNNKALIFKISAPSATVAWACAFDTAKFTPIKQVVKTTNGGTSWAAKDLGVTRTGQQITDVFALDANTAWVTAYDMLFQKGKIYKTTDGGTAWTGQNTVTFTENIPLNIFFTNATNGVVLGDIDTVSNRFEIYTTTNGGANWTRVPAANIPAPLPGKEMATGNATAFGNNIWFTTDQGRVFRSTNNGLTWSAHTTNNPYIQTIDFKDANHGWLLGTVGLEKTTNGGQTWVSVVSAGPMRYGSFCYVPGTTATLISTSGQDFDKGTSISTNGGLTWSDIETAMTHTVVKFTSLTNGYSGGPNAIRKYNATVSGVSKEEMAKEISVYPNPSSGIFKLQTASFASDKATVSVYNLLGETVQQLPVSRITPGREISLDLSKMAGGAYIVKIQADDKVLTRQLLLEK